MSRRRDKIRGGGPGSAGADLGAKRAGREAGNPPAASGKKANDGAKQAPTATPRPPGPRIGPGGPPVPGAKAMHFKESGLRFLGLVRPEGVK
ncbi:MAG: hypothetical protein LBU05_04165, partial [Bifidobacteriaceae bacterium]|nr:hypothetical protein [Bifidobacteriaceae bacterium]